MDGNNQYQPFQKHTKRVSLCLLRLERSGVIQAHRSLNLTSSGQRQGFTMLPKLVFMNSRIQAISLPRPLRTKRFPAEETHGRQRDSFGRRSCFTGAPAQRFPVRSIRDGRARLVPSPQGKQQLEALRTESFTASTANPGRSGSVENGCPPKEN
ncbi:hypothetical protein AAY473_036701 [Plecturocebus cupreus]